MTDYNLENDVFRLLREEPFFAGVSRLVNKTASTAVPTAGVKVTADGNFDMLYNANFFAGLSDVQRRGILKHEFYHLILEHCTTRKYADEVEHKLHNYATDLSINCHLKGQIPESGLFPHKFEFPEFLSAEEYIKLLREKYPPQPDNGGGSDVPDGMGELLDDHDGWGDKEGKDGDEARAIARERLRQGLKDAVNASQKAGKGFGDLPEDIKAAVMRFINGSVDWRAVLRNFIGQSQRMNRSNSIKRINKRFPYIHPGRKSNHTAHIAIAIDQSGSVDDELLGLFFAELSNLAKIATFTVVPFDTRTDDKLVYQWKKGQKHQVERVMCGGTDFNAPTEWVNKHPEIDGLIILTDMQAPAPKPCRVRRLWLTDEANKESPYFATNELVAAIKRQNNR